VDVQQRELRATGDDELDAIRALAGLTDAQPDAMAAILALPDGREDRRLDRVGGEIERQRERPRRRGVLTATAVATASRRKQREDGDDDDQARVDAGVLPHRVACRPRARAITHTPAAPLTPRQRLSRIESTFELPGVVPATPKNAIRSLLPIAASPW
jgi:hypothetical protein